MEEAKARLTPVQFAGWCRFLRLEWDEPAKTDWYLMQVALEVRRLWCSWTDTTLTKEVKDFALTFNGPDPARKAGAPRPRRVETVQEKSDRLKTALLARLRAARGARDGNGRPKPTPGRGK